MATPELVHAWQCPECEALFLEEQNAEECCFSASPGSTPLPTTCPKCLRHYEDEHHFKEVASIKVRGVCLTCTPLVSYDDQDRIEAMCQVTPRQ